MQELKDLRYNLLKELYHTDIKRSLLWQPMTNIFLVNNFIKNNLRSMLHILFKVYIEMDNKNKRESGFEDDPLLPQTKICRDPEHEPPNMLVIQQGKIYRHVCPTCGREVILRPTNFTRQEERTCPTIHG